jgi:hypothetical protein
MRYVARPPRNRSGSRTISAASSSTVSGWESSSERRPMYPAMPPFVVFPLAMAARTEW